MSELTSENFRFLLWREGVERSSWVAHLAEWAGCDSKRALALLRGVEPLPEEQQQIVDRVKVPEEDIRFRRLVEERDSILQDNLDYLLGSLEHGEKKVLAKTIDANPTTISRWHSGEQRPRVANLLAICRFFGLPASTDLKVDAVFLSLDPVGDRERREWAHERLEQLDSDDLRDLYPALKRLFGD